MAEMNDGKFIPYCVDEDNINDCPWSLFGMCMAFADEFCDDGENERQKCIDYLTALKDEEEREKELEEMDFDFRHFTDEELKNFITQAQEELDDREDDEEKRIAFEGINESLDTLEAYINHTSGCRIVGFVMDDDNSNIPVTIDDLRYWFKKYWDDEE